MLFTRQCKNVLCNYTKYPNSIHFFLNFQFFKKTPPSGISNPICGGSLELLILTIKQSGLEWKNIDAQKLGVGGGVKRCWHYFFSCVSSGPSPWRHFFIQSRFRSSESRLFEFSFKLAHTLYMTQSIGKCARASGDWVGFTSDCLICQQCTVKARVNYVHHLHVNENRSW